MSDGPVHFYETTIDQYEYEIGAHVISLPGSLTADLNSPPTHPLSNLTNALRAEEPVDNYMVAGGRMIYERIGDLLEESRAAGLLESPNWDRRSAHGVVEDLLFAPVIVVEESVPVGRALGTLLNVGAASMAYLDGHPVLLAMSGTSAFIIWLTAPVLEKTRDAVADEVSEHVRARVRRWLAERGESRDREEVPAET
jgi:hypothetical protein